MWAARAWRLQGRLAAETAPCLTQCRLLQSADMTPQLSPPTLECRQQTQAHNTQQTNTGHHKDASAEHIWLTRNDVACDKDAREHVSYDTYI